MSKYRICQYKYQSGKRKYKIQERRWGIWFDLGFPDEGGFDTTWYNTLEEAQENVGDRLVVEKSFFPTTQ